jgi:glutathione synthase/RimK-type ligase-like ATP-grasp enzyme
VATQADLPVPPFLLRPAGSHGGVGVQRIDTQAEAAGHVLDTANTWYATKFIDCRAADGYVRKYRIIFVGGVPYPYHLAISDNWLVHYFYADMPDHDWKLREEQQFLDDWQSTIGAQATAAIQDIGKRLRLDYGGIDFSLLPDGTLLVFEANATMLVHPEDADGPLADKNRSVQTIVQAFGQMLHLRLS